MVISKLGWRKSLRGQNIFRPYIGCSGLKVKDHNPAPINMLLGIGLDELGEFDAVTKGIAELEAITTGDGNLLFDR